LSLPPAPGSSEQGDVRTHPHHVDPTLKGRTYAIPFTRVWRGVSELAGGKLRGWSTLEADEDDGILRAECVSLVFKKVDDIEIRLSLDENALTRVDASGSPREETGGTRRVTKRIRTLFNALDRWLGAGPTTILDPTIPVRSALMLPLLLVVGCSPGTDGPEASEMDSASDSVAVDRNFQARSYERHIVFLTFQGDSTLVVPLAFSARTRPEGVEREMRGWLARGLTWDPFLNEAWTDPPSAAPWRILPHGPVRLVVGPGDAVESILFQEGGRNLDVTIGELIVEWSGQQAQTYRVHEATIVLSDQTVEGHLLDLSRAWAPVTDPSPGDWGILLSGDSVQIALEDLSPDSGEEGGEFSLHARVSFLDRQWQGIRLAWGETRPFEPARRDVPMDWTVLSAEGDLEGSLSATASFLEVVDGEGPVLPVEGLFQVSGTLTLAGSEYPVRGFLRHRQH
jgi:hypothetical protein